MKIPTQAPIDQNHLMAHLTAALPSYRVKTRASFIIVEKNGWVGANVVVRKNKVIVVGSFPNMGLQLLFVLSVVFLGILVPLLLYFIFLFGKQRAIEKEVGAVVQGYVVNPMAAVPAAPGYGAQPQVAGGYPQQPALPAGVPPQGMPPQYAAPPQGMPPQGMPPQGMPPQGMPPQPGAPGPQHGAPPQGMPPQPGPPPPGYPQQ